MDTHARIATIALFLAGSLVSACSANEPSGSAADAGNPAAAGAPASATAGAGAGGTAGSAVSAGGAGGTPSMASGGTGADAAGELLGTPLAGKLSAFEESPHSLAPTALWGALERPLPTNAWWENLVLGKGESPVNVLPYLVAASEVGLRVCQPKQVVERDFTFSVMNDDWVLGAVEALSGRTVTAHDALSVTLEWRGEQGTMRTPLVQGMAYASARYHGLRPRLRSAQAVTAIDGAPARSFDAARFEISLNSGQTWRVYSSQTLSWSWDGEQLEAKQAFDGWLRLARVDAEGLGALLDQHAESVAVGGKVSGSATGDTARLIFDWQTEGSGTPLSFALPHHLPTLKTPLTNASLATIRGKMVAVEGAQWQFDEPLTRIAWNAARAIAPERREAVLSALRSDAQTIAPTGAEPYFFGKQVAAVARLVLIADELGEDALAGELRAKIAGWLEPWLAGGASSRLVYDSSWGGLVSRPGIADASADFGLGYYNDHHFQYGYFVYSAAVVARKDSAWAERNRAAVEVILRDYANPAADGYFPASRCKDWFAGHSWAAGIFEFADSRNQESTSEAINGYYAVYLWGLATGDTRVRDFGRLLLGTELRAAQTYWQVEDETIYPAPFSQHKIVGVLWATKADHTTWFGNQLEFIHGIQWMPFTPMSEELLPRAWMEQSYPLVAGALQRAEPSMGEGWRGLVHMAHAIVDPAAAWQEVSALGTFDDGNSRTNALYWVATR